MRRTLFIALLLVGGTLALYWPVHEFGLVYYDDPLFLTEAPPIQSGLNWHSFGWAFSSVVLANWHPITTLSFVIDHQLFGTNPGAEHAVNAVFHAVNAGLLFLLLHGLTRAAWRSALVAALFAWHPLRVESVAWITERKDVLSGFFFFLTLLFYAQWAPRPGPGRPGKSSGPQSRGPWSGGYRASLAALALGLMCKAMLVTVPLVLLLLDLWPLQRLFPAGPAGACDPGRAAAPPARPPFWQTLRCLAWEKWPFFALTAVFCGLTYAIQQNSDAVVSLDHLGWNYRLANALSSYGRYLGKLVWPADLAVVYPYHRIDDWLQTGMIALVLALVSGFCLRQCRRRPWLTVGWFWYLITALPIIGLVQVGEASMADRYTYLPLIGPVLALVWLIPPTWWRTRFQRVLLGLGTAVGLSALALATRLQIQYWRDTVSLFTHAIAVTGDNPGAESGLGFGLEHEGRLDEALEHHRRARQLNPADRGNHLKVGQLLMQQQQWAEAADSLLTALALKPNDAATHEDLAAVLPHLGRYEETRQHWEAARQLAPADPGVLNNLAWLLATCPDPNLWDGPRAVSLAQRACELTRFQTTMFLGTLAAAQARAGRFDDATATARRACDLATAQGQAELLRRNQELLARYQQHQAWREPAGR